MSLENDNIEFSSAAWKRLQHTTSFGSAKRSIHLFVGPSADAAAAWKTMRHLLRSYLTCEEVHIIEHIGSAYSIIRARAKALEEQATGFDDTSSVREVAVFLGCGANADLPRELDWSALAEVHVIDNHRPVNLNLMRAAIESKRFLAAVQAGDFGGVGAAAKPDKCIFLWDHASAEREIDQFFLHWEMGAARKSSGARLLRQPGAAKRRRRTDDEEEDGDKKKRDGTAKKAKASTTAKQRAIEKRDHTLAGLGRKNDDDDDDNEGGENSNNSRTPSGNKAQKKIKKEKFASETDDSDDDEEDSESDASFVDPDDVVEAGEAGDEDADDGDSSWGSSSSSSASDDDDSIFALGIDGGGQKPSETRKKKEKQKKSKQASTKKATKADDVVVVVDSSMKPKQEQREDDDDNDLAAKRARSRSAGEAASSSNKKKRRGGKKKKNKNNAADDDVDDFIENDLDDEDDDEEDESDDLSSDAEEDDNDGENENFATTTDADWSAVFTGGGTASNNYSNNNNNKEDDDDDYAYYGEGKNSLMALWRTAEGVGPSREVHYYSRIFAGRSLAVVFHELALRLEQTDPEFVWHAAIGIADLRSRGLIAPAVYESEMRKLESAVLQFDSAVRRSNAGMTLASIHPNAFNNGGNGAGGRGGPASIGASGKLTHISKCMHIKLFLLNHCTLWQALWYDRHVSAALGLLQPGLHTNSSGTDTLQTLLSDVGMPISDAKEYKWLDLSSDTRNYVLPRLLEQLRKQFKVADMSSVFDSSGRNGAGGGSSGDAEVKIPSLCKKVGYDDPVTAFDACQLFYGCLGALGSHQHLAFHGGGAAAADGANGGGLLNNPHQLRQDEYRRCFENGVAVLSASPESELFKRARDETISLQDKVTDATETILSGGGGSAAASLTLMTNVQNVTVPLEHRIAAIEHFSVPARLRALAMFLSAYQHNYGGGWQRNARRQALNGRTINRASPIVIGIADSSAASGIAAAQTSSDQIVGCVAMVLAPPAVVGGDAGGALSGSSASKLRYTTPTNASLAPSSVLAHYREVQRQLSMDGGFCGAWRDLCIGSVVGAEAIREVGDLLHLEVYMAGQGVFPTASSSSNNNNNQPGAGALVM